MLLFILNTLPVLSPSSQPQSSLLNSVCLTRTRVCLRIMGLPHNKTFLRYTVYKYVRFLFTVCIYIIDTVCIYYL